MSAAPIDACAVLHVAGYDCFGDKARAHPDQPATVARAACWRCLRMARLVRCTRCGSYHCAPDQRAERRTIGGAL